MTLQQLLIWDTCWGQAYALLYDSVNKEDLTIRIGAIMGLGLAYAGSQKEEVRSFTIYGFSLYGSVPSVFHFCLRQLLLTLVLIMAVS